MTFVIVGLVLVAAVGFAVKTGLARRSAKVVIETPTLGVLNLAGPSGDALALEDLEQLGPLFASVRRSDGNPPACDVLLIYCDIAGSGRVEGSRRSLREIIRDAGAQIVVVAKNHPVNAYIAAAPRQPFGQANLVMTLDRKGAGLATFLARLFSQMTAGTCMPDAWNQLAPQVTHVDHGEAPETIFSCERGQVAFGAAQPAVADG
jgi:hypothetical protein